MLQCEGGLCYNVWRSRFLSPTPPAYLEATPLAITSQHRQACGRIVVISSRLPSVFFLRWSPMRPPNRHLIAGPHGAFRLCVLYGALSDFPHESEVAERSLIQPVHHTLLVTEWAAHKTTPK